MMEAATNLPEEPSTKAGDEQAAIANLRLRLQSSQIQELAARTEARRLARELTLARRLLKFASDNLPVAPPEAIGADPTPVRAALLEDKMIYHVDACENRGAHTAISGWAFCPAPGWDGRATTATFIFRHGAIVYYAAARRVARPDVAAHYAAQRDDPAGGARGLDQVGFAGEILHDSLPAGVDLELALRLECASLVCEQPLGKRLRL